jgi:non-specific serine/threonine protein kinase
VFEGGWTLDAAATVAADSSAGSPAPPASAREGQPAAPGQPPAVLNDLAALVELHLVAPEGGATDEPRFVMLETIREFAREQLAASGKEAALRERHADHLLAWGEIAGRRLESAEEQRWQGRVKRELPNVRAAVGWLRERGQAAAGLRLAAALGPFWFTAGYIGEGRRWLDQPLRSPDAPHAPAVAAPTRPVAWVRHLASHVLHLGRLTL